MMEKMFTTKMSMDKKKLQNRFSKIRSKNSKPANIVALVLFAVIIVAIIGVSIYVAVNKLDDVNLYKNEKFNIQFEIPNDWKGKYIIDESTIDDGYISCKHKAIAEKHNGMGTLFTIHKYPDNELEEILLMVGNQTVLWQNEEYAYVLGRPTDVQVPIFEDSDKEDYALSEDYTTMKKGIEQIEKTFKLIKDVPVPVIENAENLSYMQIRDLQRQVNNGHFPWRLDYEQVVMVYLSGKGIDVEGGKVTALAGGSDNISLTYSVSGKEYLFDMFKPIDKTEHGIWVVKSYNNRKKIVTNVSFHDTTSYENWIEKRDDGWYDLPTKTIVAVFPDVESPISVTAYYTDSGTGMEDEKQQLSKITKPYTYRTNAKVLSMEVPFPREDIHGHLWFEFEYENGEKVTSAYFNVHREPVSDPPKSPVREDNNISAVTSHPTETSEDDIGFSQVVFEEETSIKDIQTTLKKSGKNYTVNNYSYKDNCNSTESNVACDSNGNISLFFDINAENLVDVTFKDSVTKEEVAQFGILANDVNSYSFTGFDKNKSYDITIQGKTDDTWKIEGEYIIY